MVYEGNVNVINDDGTAFTFDSPDGRRRGSRCTSTWSRPAPSTTTVLTTKDDRVGLLLFSAGQAPFYQTGPNLIREVKSNNADALRRTSPSRRLPVGKSGVLGKGLMAHLRQQADTKFPNASIALAQFFTNPRSMVEFAKQVAVYPSSAVGLRRSVLQLDAPTADRGQRPAARQGHHLDLRRTSSRPSRRRPTSTRSSSRRSSRRCSTTCPRSRP